MSDAPTPTGRARLRRALTIALVTLLVGLVAAELLARYKFSGPIHLLRHADDPELIFELVPGEYVSNGYFTRSEPVSYSVTDEGCRAPEPAHLGHRPVYLLGSSLVFGIAVENEDSLPEAVWRATNALDPTIDFEPRNCSVPGYALLQTLRHAEIAIERGESDTLVLIIDPEAHLHQPFDWSITSPSSPGLRALTDNSRLARLVYLFGIIRQTDGFDFPDAPRERIAAAMAELQTVAEPAGVHVLAFVFHNGSERADRVMEDAQAAGFEVHDVTPPRREAPYLHPDGDHWARAGNEALAAQMAPHLVAHLQRVWQTDDDSGAPATP